ncbi:hypothetical protein HMN09_00188000 [Mycena chlorophos]|uniref:Uncharacterized protein n=1 Tax=Mycena chlorophos TaxID=658473 RepID=A0A8H6TQL8_MYCCL|nr:hypothetical protein HMN09_00188000 [Mycena chlorophos]
MSHPSPAPTRGSPPRLLVRLPHLSLALDTDVDGLYFGLRSRTAHIFLEAARNLIVALSPSNLSSADLRRHSRKIIRLLETARDTLQAIGLSLYSFAACPERRQERKDAYFDLLRIVASRRDDIDPALSGRMNALLARLSSNFQIRRQDGATQPAVDDSIAGWSSPQNTRLPVRQPRFSMPGHHFRASSPRVPGAEPAEIISRPRLAGAPSSKSYSSPPDTSARLVSLMPPPDAFTKKYVGRAGSQDSCRPSEIIGSTVAVKYRRQQRSRSIDWETEEDSDNEEANSCSSPISSEDSRAQTPPPHSAPPSVVGFNLPPRFARKHARTRDPPCPAVLAQLEREMGEDEARELRRAAKLARPRKHHHHHTRKTEKVVVGGPDSAESEPGSNLDGGDSTSVRFKLASRPLAGRFGIFCTPKGSMHSYSGRARPA